MIFRESNTPRWIIFILDLGISFFAFVMAYLLRFDFAIPAYEVAPFWYLVPSVLSIRAISFVLGKTYAGIIRYTSTKDAQRIFVVLTAGSVVIGLADLLVHELTGHYPIPRTVVIIDYLVAAFVMIVMRIAIKLLYYELKSPARQKSKVLIFGAGDAGIIAMRTLDRDAGTGYKVKALVDDNRKKHGKKIEGVPIYHSDKLPDLLDDEDLAHVIIAVQNIGPTRKREIIEQCLAQDVEVLNVPPVTNWINGELSVKQIRHASVEDLLGRDPIELDMDAIRQRLKGKTILVTGAAGSIGSELCRQIAAFEPKKLILLDQAESPIYELDLELQNTYKERFCEVVMGDIRHRQRMENLYDTFRPEVVFHAAAYKHVPLMELNPSEAVRTNIQGTKNMADLSVKYGVKTFVMVSTDKAVNPTNIMGASKRIAEIYCQTVSKSGNTAFVTTRFGNVLGSQGSVIPLFRRQIEEGGPLTVTDPEVTRFFMTIQEAAQLVLEAAAMSTGSEIFAFDMGKSVKIVNLAKQMIRLSGLELGKDIEIKFTGLRPGEKLYEEVLADKENTLATHHPRILKARVREHEATTVARQVDELIDLYVSQNNEAIVALMKAIVPEYKSQNSEFSKLDKPEENPSEATAQTSATNNE